MQVSSHDLFYFKSISKAYKGTSQSGSWLVDYLVSLFLTLYWTLQMQFPDLITFFHISFTCADHPAPLGKSSYFTRVISTLGQSAYSGSCYHKCHDTQYTHLPLQIPEHTVLTYHLFTVPTTDQMLSYFCLCIPII